jgi:hypothetical protein
LAVGGQQEFVKVDYEEEAQVAAALQVHAGQGAPLSGAGVLTAVRQPLMAAAVTGFPTYLVFHRGKKGPPPPPPPPDSGGAGGLPTAAKSNAHPRPATLQVGRCGGDKAALARLLASATGADAHALRRAVGLR